MMQLWYVKILCVMPIWAKTMSRLHLDGTKEIGLAVLATTLTIVAVFLPVAFMGGIIGRFSINLVSPSVLPY